MKHIKLFEQFINEALDPSKLKEKFTKETGISTWDRVKSENEKGVWTVTSIFTSKERGGTGEGLRIQISQGRTVGHFMVMDDDGNLTSGARRLKKMNESDTESIFEAKVNEGFYSAKDIKKLKEFAEKVSSEIMDAYEDDFDRKSKNIDADDYTPKKMFDYLSNWGEGNDMKADDVIDEYDWESFTQELGLETYRG